MEMNPNFDDDYSGSDDQYPERAARSDFLAIAISLGGFWLAIILLIINILSD